MNVTLLLQPAIEHSRSMLLYAERLTANAPADTRVVMSRLPAVGGAISRRLADLLAPPMFVPRVESGVAHVVDHAHAGYVRFLKVPGVVTVHDLIPLKAIRGRYHAGIGRAVSPRSRFWFQWNVAALPAAAALVAPSRATADDVRDLIGNLPVEVVPHGVDPDFFQDPGAGAAARVAERLGALAGRRLLLQVTNGFFYKNDPGFARAFALLEQSHPDLVWVRVGAPPPPTGEALPTDRFVYYDRAGLGELVALYRRASVLLFPSWDEGFGWPPLEAMAAGCPVVASDRGALAETAAPAALVADPGDPADMAARVASVLDNPDLAAELTERGRAHAATYTWSRAGRHMAEIYRGVYFSK